MGKIYAVKKGKKTGIFYNWNECKAQVHGFPCSEYKSFDENDIDAANEFLLAVKNNSNGDKMEFTEKELNEIIQNKEEIVAFVDGSYDEIQNRYSYGMVALGMGVVFEDYCDDFEPENLKMRQVAGEILGATTAMEYCVDNNIKLLKLYYDYEGVEKWLTGSWKCNKIGTKQYLDYYLSIKDILKVEFYKVPAHTGIKYNDRADYLAKKALNLV